MRQAFVPMRYGEPVGLFYPALVEDAVKGTVCPAGILVAADRLYPASGDAGQSVNGNGEVVPTASPLVGEMVYARHKRLGLQYGENGLCQIGGAGG